MLTNSTKRKLMSELEYLLETDGNHARVEEIRAMFRKHNNYKGVRKNESS